MSTTNPRIKTFFVLYEMYDLGAYKKFSCIIGLDVDLIGGRGIYYVKQKVRQKELLDNVEPITILDIKSIDI